MVRSTHAMLRRASHGDKRGAALCVGRDDISSGERDAILRTLDWQAD